MKRVLVITRREMLFQKIRLELSGLCECQISEGYREGFDIVLSDAESVEEQVGIILGREEGCDISLPFAIGALRDRLFNSERAALTYDEKTRRVLLGGTSATLTEVEGALFEALLDGGGEFVSRERLLKRVWGDGASGGVLSVYVHYLREKLERDGRRVILSSREMGYKINEEVLKNA